VPLVEREVKFSLVNERLRCRLNLTGDLIDHQQVLRGRRDSLLFEKASLVRKVSKGYVYDPSVKESLADVVWN
jgi:hypothetical protein